MLPAVPSPALPAAAAAPVALAAAAPEPPRLPVVPRSLLFSAVRNEGPFLLEWIAYHRAIGFERIFIVSNDCTDGTDLLLQALAAAGVVGHVATTVPEGISPQANAAKIGRKRRLLQDGDWAIWLDADEFLNVHRGAGGLSDLIAAAGSAHGTIIPWRVFGDSGQPRFPGRFLSGDFTRASTDAFKYNRSLKMLFRKHRGVVGFSKFGVHRPKLLAGNTLTENDFLDGTGRALNSASEVNQSWLRGRDIAPTCWMSDSEFGWDIAQLNHYCVRTPEHFLLKRIRGRGCARSRMSERHTDEFYQMMNRNEEEDRSILRHEAAVTAEIARLRELPGVAEAEAGIARRVAAQLAALETAGSVSENATAAAGPAPAIGGKRDSPRTPAPLPVVSRSLLFSAVRNEGPFLLEWIAYHRVIGFERIFIVSNDCTDGTDLLLQALAAAGVVGHVATTVPEGVRPQAQAGKLGRKRKLLEPGDWALWLDADEFLNVHAGQGGLADLVAAVGPRRGMLISGRAFGDGGGGRFDGRFVAPRFSRAAPAGFRLNREVQTLFQAGDGIVGFARYGINRPLLARDHPFSCADFVGSSGRTLDPESPWNAKWFKGRDTGGTNMVTAPEFGWDLAQINHYCVRTPEHFRLKRLRGRGYAKKGADRPRHTDEFYQVMNRNEEEDRSILRHEAAVTAEMARLRELPGVAEAEAGIARRVAAQLAALEAGDGGEHARPDTRPALDATGKEAGRAAQPVPPRAGAPAATPATGPAAAAPDRPELTFPAAEAARVRAGYAEAAVILEYGSGGSTVLASELPGKTVFSVESDADWCTRMQAWFAASPGRSPVVLHHADIGPTKRWGRPKGTAGLKGWPGYPLSVWERPDFRHPDLVLIDGRFRPACFFATLFRISRPVTVLWDDYTERPEYHHVEAFAAPVARHGRMAEFHLTPQSLPGARLGQVVAAFLDPQ